jgi:uncharacterized protein YlxW (UPF0749 family)
MTAKESQPFRVHEQDLNLLLNELKAAGAEALAVAGADAKTFQRVVPTTTVRCAGPAFIVNGSRLSPPLTVVAIGNPRNLRAGLTMPGGYVEARGLEILKMIGIQEADSLSLPAYGGDLRPRFAKPTP